MNLLERTLASRHLAVSAEWNPEDALRALRAFVQSPERKLRILIVDDTKTDQELLIDKLRKFECRIAVATYTHEAVAMIGDADYDLVFVDLKLPPRDGLEVIRQTRAGMKPKTRFVVTSGHPNLIEKVSEFGGLFIFRKPITEDDVELLFGTLEGSPYG